MAVGGVARPQAAGVSHAGMVLLVTSALFIGCRASGINHDYLESFKANWAGSQELKEDVAGFVNAAAGRQGGLIVSPELRGFVEATLRPRHYVKPLAYAPATSTGRVRGGASAPGTSKPGTTLGDGGTAGFGAELSEGCLAAMMHTFIQSGLKSAAAIGMIDAAGKPTPGIFTLNSKFWGSYAECQLLANASYCMVSADIILYDLLLPSYLLGYTPHTWGFCLPKQCSETDVAIMFRDAELNNTALPIKSLYEVAPGTPVTADCQLNSPYDTKSIVAVFICSLLGFFVLVGTTMDWIAELWSEAATVADEIPTPAHPQPIAHPVAAKQSQALDIQHHGPVVCTADETAAEHETNETGSSLADESAPLIPPNDQDTTAGYHSLSSQVADHSESNSLLASQEIQRDAFQRLMGTLVARFFLCFSLVRNGKRLLDTNVPNGAITSVNGIRVLSISWVLLGHTHLLSLNYLTSPAVLVSVSERFTFQTVSNAYFAVDSFFLLSGLLVMYLALKQMDGNSGRLPFSKFYFHRIWRLTPSYMIVLMILYCLVPHMGSGPLWKGAVAYTDHCQKYWWTNLLYINNFYPTNFDDQCFSWAWYLANDMQFYVLSPIIIVLMYRSKKAGFAATAAIMAATFAATAVLCAHYNFPVGTIAKQAPAANYSQKYASIVYEKPYCRASPYLIGLLLGTILRRKEDFKLPFHLLQPSYTRALRIVLVLVCWSLAAVLFMVTLYGLYHVSHNKTFLTKPQMVMYITFSRPAWSLALAWMIWACHSGYGSWINSILSMRFWIPLSRLSYSVYLVHVVVVLVGYGCMQEPFAYTDTIMAFYFLGFLLMSFVVATVLYLAAEAPLMELEKIFLKTHRSPRPAN